MQLINFNRWYWQFNLPIQFDLSDTIKPSGLESANRTEIPIDGNIGGPINGLILTAKKVS